MEPPVQRLGQNVRAARHARGWTQEDLSHASGLAVVHQGERIIAAPGSEAALSSVAGPDVEYHFPVHVITFG